ncbi:RNA polymerase sigma-70 factor [Echinicola rosea]|uniref:DNA-directed RNA polymerase sigma-70 factor n=1 Tax=Echinicola rosea TaxID=1807691 RepID=A0ABQ1V6E1_9BACT|nr:RNA polymerase sigma-70 factor [Echinicola rosea]GGF40997.1 DNA-directed RNA polymerase sigma-70 factor [Echinicola rosea]
MNTLTDDIAFKIKNNDKNAFYELYQLFHERIYLFCVHYGLKTVDAEEITQDVFVKLWTARQKIDPSKCLKAYLFTIAKNTMLDMFKKQIRQKATKTYQMQLILPVNNTQNTVEYNELMGLVEKTLTRLPERRRMVFEMSRLQGLSHKEIAAQLDISTKTVENHLTLALQNFREVFQDAQILSLALLALYFSYQ